MTVGQQLGAPAVDVRLPSPAPRRSLARAVLGAGGPWALRVVSVAIVLLVWQVAGANYPYATSTPGAVVGSLADELGGVLLPAFWLTLKTFLIGFGICVALGIALGLAMARVRLLRVMLEPYVMMIYSTPFIAFFPVLILVLGITDQLRLSVVIIGGTMAVALNTFLGAREVEANLLDVGAAFAARPFQVLRTVVLPGSVPYIFAGIRIAFMKAMVGTIVLEIQSSADGVGAVLRESGLRLQLDRYFAMVIVLGVFNLLFTTWLRTIERSVTDPASRRRARQRTADIRRWARAATGAAARALRLDAVGRLGARRLVTEPRPSPVRRVLDAVVATPVGRVVVRLATFAAIIGLWHWYAQGVSRAVLPQPLEVTDAVWQQTFVTREIWGPLGFSLEVLAVGYLLSLVIGILLGIAMGRSRLAEFMLDPYVAFVYALPNAVFVPIMIVWLELGFTFRVAYVTLSAVFPIAINTMAGVKNVSDELISTGRSFCASERQILRTVVVPGIVPFTLAGAQLGFSAAWIGVVVSEILTTQVGLGGRINYYSSVFLTADMWVPILYIMVIAVVILRVSKWALPKLAPWSEGARAVS